MGGVGGGGFHGMAEPGAVLMQGALDKKMKSRMRGFKSRWFVLRAKELVYYDSEAAALKSPEAPLGVIPLAVRRVPPPPPPPSQETRPASGALLGTGGPSPSPPGPPLYWRAPRAWAGAETRPPRRTAFSRSPTGLRPRRTPSASRLTTPP